MFHSCREQCPDPACEAVPAPVAGMEGKGGWLVTVPQWLRVCQLGGEPTV